MKTYQSKAGYLGGIALGLTAIANYLYENRDIRFVLANLDREPRLLLAILVVFAVMVVFELWSLSKHKKKINGPGSQKKIKKHNNNLLYLYSSVLRVLAVLLLIGLAFFLIHNHYYFQNQVFSISRQFYEYLLWAYLILGIPYSFLTLKYKGGTAYEFNDYGILLLISYKTLILLIAYKVFNLINPKSKKSTGQLLKRIRNKRIIKVYLVFLVNFFFLTLMTRFFLQEYSAFNFALLRLNSEMYQFFTSYQVFHAWYQVFFHFIFYVDVGIAIIGYTVASRWLNNRTKSVDMTLYGWFVVLLCYPPMNSGFSDQFIGYGQFQTHAIVTSETIKMILMSMILLSYTIYVWATLALGFKFSNLTNRGIISHGPYRFMRHPAYASKNFAWWLDNTHILSNIWASMALLAWNIIYALRGITEERHLMQDNAYKDYVLQVKNRFIPNFKRKNS